MLQASLYSALCAGFPYRILLCKDYEEALAAYHSALYAHDSAIDSAQNAKPAHKDRPASAENMARATPHSIPRPILCKEMRLHYGDDVRSFFVEFVENLAHLRDFYADDDTLLIAPITSLLHPLPSPKHCQNLVLETTQSYDLQALKSQLLRLGYESVEMIEMEGEVSFRGDIIDIYPPLSKPYRISFFDDECEEIHSFSLDTQLKGKDAVQTLTIPPALFSLESSEYEELCELLESSELDTMSRDIQSIGLWYLPDRLLLPAHYPSTLTSAAYYELQELQGFAKEQSALDFGVDSKAESKTKSSLDSSTQPTLESNAQDSRLDSNALDSSSPESTGSMAFWETLPIFDKSNTDKLDLDKPDTQAPHHRSHEATSNAPHIPKSSTPKSPTPCQDIHFSIDKLQGLLTHHADKRTTLVVRFSTELAALPPALTERARILESNAIVHMLVGDELILSLESSPKSRAAHTTRAKRPKFALNELNIGEYVVHSEYGIGIFKGIVQSSILGITRDFIHIQYFGEDKLLLPVENLHMIDRYIASSIPIIDRLGKGSFAKLKAKAREKLFAIADSIIKLAAKRNLLQGQIIDVESPELAVFKHAAGFTLTSDQQRAIESIYQDLASGRVMDRLLSGDVGFGKTEVAMNAIFAVCRSGYQCALIVPTTLLSAQHFATALTRLAPFGLRVGKCDRYLSPKEKRATLDALKNGQLDVIIGTHALFGAEFARLGLIVVDEEHRFGVKQKESLKALSANVHLLSMSATPIPRTLNMALSHIKGMSTLETPPISRKDSRTFIKHKSDPLLKEIISREIRRGGQVFYIYNNIASMPRVFSHLQELFPSLKLAMLHSQIPAKESEEIMHGFGLGEYQILLCTAIIESGIHLPNANTIIIDGADRFGLADLHQLRGRVGRGDREGFCYFLIESMESITDEARKRLLALERNSYLGSGASIAYQDLEIRGGGNVIGESQSGHIKNIGFSLYLKLLEDALSQLSNHAQILENSVELRINISAYLSPDLIASDTLRLELYRRLSLCKEIAQVAAIEHEIRDRFGELDTMSSNFIQLIIIKILANNAHIKAISHFGQNIQITKSAQDSSQDSVQNFGKDSGQSSSQNLGQNFGAAEQKLSLKSPTSDDDCVLETLLTHLRSIQPRI